MLNRITARLKERWGRLRRIEPRSWLAAISLLALTVGLGMERLSLALIVPGAIVFACLVWSHVRGTDVKESEADV